MNTSTSKKCLFGALSVAAVVAVAALAMHERSTSDEATRARGQTTPRPTLTGPSRSSCAFRSGDRLAFELTTESAASIDVAPLLSRARSGAIQLGLNASPAQQQTSRAAWRLDLEAHDIDPGQGAVLAARLTPTGDAPSKTLGSTFLMRVGADCAIQSYAWRAGGAEEEAHEQQAIVSQLSFAIDDAGAHGVDALGEYRATFEATPDGLRQAGRLEAYTRSFIKNTGRLDLATTLEIVHSEIAVELGADGWFASSEAALEVKLTAGGLTIGELTRAHRARALSPADWRADIDVNDPAWRWGTLLGRLGGGRPSAPVRGALIGVSTKDAFLELQRRMKRPGGGILGHADYLRDWILANPQALRDVEAMLRADAFADAPSARSALFLALGRANSPQTRQFLLSLVRDDTFPRGDIVSAATALTRADPVPEGYVEALIARCGEPERNQRGAFSTIVGMVASEQAALNPEVAAAARQQIDAWLSEPTDDAQLRHGLVSAGNAGSGALLSAIDPHLDADDPELRALAARALRRMPAGEALPRLERLIEEDGSEAVRRQAYRALTAQLQRDQGLALPSSIRARLIEAIPEIPAGSPEFASTVRLVGLAATRGDQEAQAVLARQFTTEMTRSPRDHQRLQALGQFHNAAWRATR